MKTKIFYAALITGLFFGTSIGGAQTSSGARGVAPVVPRAIIPPSGSTVTPGDPGNRMLQPQPGAQNQLNSTATSTLTTNSVSGTTNGFSGTNALTGINTNGPSVTATVNPMTNAITGSNTDVNGNTVAGNQAVTSSDRILLTTLSQGIRATLGITPNGNLPVHFMINNGTVTVVGTVQSTAQSQSVLSQVQQTPGVIGVISDLHVAEPFGSAQSRASSQTGLFGGQADHAFTPRDQTLLTTVQQQAAMQLGINNASQMPVHFSIQDGIVGVTGQVSSLQEKQALFSAIQRTPGIVRVVDNVGVLGGAAGMNNNLPATSRDSGQSNFMFLNTTNPSGL